MAPLSTFACLSLHLSCHYRMLDRRHGQQRAWALIRLFSENRRSMIVRNRLPLKFLPGPIHHTFRLPRSIGRHPGDLHLSPPRSPRRRIFSPVMAKVLRPPCRLNRLWTVILSSAAGVFQARHEVRRLGLSLAREIKIRICFLPAQIRSTTSATAHAR